MWAHTRVGVRVRTLYRRVLLFKVLMRVEAGLLVCAALVSSLLPFPPPPLLSFCPSSSSPCLALAGTGLFWFIECRARRICACVETVKCARCVQHWRRCARMCIRTHASTPQIMLTAVSKTCMSLVSCWKLLSWMSWCSNVVCPVRNIYLNVARNSIKYVLVKAKYILIFYQWWMKYS